MAAALRDAGWRLGGGDVPGARHVRDLAVTSTSHDCPDYRLAWTARETARGATVGMGYSNAA